MGSYFLLLERTAFSSLLRSVGLQILPSLGAGEAWKWGIFLPISPNPLKLGHVYRSMIALSKVHVLAALFGKCKFLLLYCPCVKVAKKKSLGRLEKLNINKIAAMLCEEPALLHFHPTVPVRAESPRKPSLTFQSTVTSALFSNLLFKFHNLALKVT